MVGRLTLFVAIEIKFVARNKSVEFSGADPRCAAYFELPERTERRRTANPTHASPASIKA